MGACIILNIEDIKPSFVVTLITDTIILVTMLVGLFRPLNDCSYTFGVGRLLWKQVGSPLFPLCDALEPLTLFPILKGIIWLLIATVAEVPPTASFASLPIYHFSHHYMNDQVFIFLNLNGIVCSLFSPCIDEGT
jgi:hypothetical protein